MSLVVAGVGVAVSAAAVADNMANKGSGGASSGSGGSLFSNSNANNPYYGVHISTQPLSGEKSKSPSTLSPDKADKATVATARGTPTQGAEQNAAEGKQDFNNQWADRLSRYIGYNTRELG